MNRSVQMFKLKEMRDEAQIINVEGSTKVRFDNIMFREDIISKIEIFKYRSKHGEGEIVRVTDSLFVRVYAGNLLLGTKVHDGDIVVEIEFNTENEPKDYYIREPFEWDYK